MSQRNKIETDSEILYLSDFVDYTHQSLLKNIPSQQKNNQPQNTLDINNDPIWLNSNYQNETAHSESDSNEIVLGKFKKSFKKQEQHDSPIVCARFSNDAEYSL